MAFRGARRCGASLDSRLTAVSGWSDAKCCCVPLKNQKVVGCSYPLLQTVSDSKKKTPQCICNLMYQHATKDLPHCEIITVDCWVLLPHISVTPYLTTNAHGRTLRSNTLKRGILSTPKGEKRFYYADWDSFWLPWNSWNLPFSRVKQGLLVEDGINGNRCLTGLSIANDQFPLSTADGNQTVHCFQTSGPHSVSVAAFRGEYEVCLEKNVRKGHKGMDLTQILKFEWW